MPAVTFEQATRMFSGQDRSAVNHLDLDVEDGRLLIDDEVITDLLPKARDIAMVSRNYSLYPYMTVADNLGFALKVEGVNKTVISARVADAARMLDIVVEP